MPRIDILYNDDKKEKHDSHTIELSFYIDGCAIPIPFTLSSIYEDSKENAFNELKELLGKNLDTLKKIVKDVEEMIEDIESGNGIDYIEVNGLGEKIAKGHYPDE